MIKTKSIVKGIVKGSARTKKANGHKTKWVNKRKTMYGGRKWWQLWKPKNTAVSAPVSTPVNASNTNHTYEISLLDLYRHFNISDRVCIINYIINSALNDKTLHQLQQDLTIKYKFNELNHKNKTANLTITYKSFALFTDIIKAKVDPILADYNHYVYMSDMHNNNSNDPNIYILKLHSAIYNFMLFYNKIMHNEIIRNKTHNNTQSPPPYTPESYKNLHSIKSGYFINLYIERPPKIKKENPPQINIINHINRTSFSNSTNSTNTKTSSINNSTANTANTNTNTLKTIPRGSFNQYMTFSDLVGNELIENQAMLYTFYYNQKHKKLFNSVAIDSNSDRDNSQNVLIKYKINNLVNNNSDSLNKYNDINDSAKIIIDPKSLKDTKLRIAILYIYYNFNSALYKALDENQYTKLLMYLKNISEIIKKSIHTHKQYISDRLQNNKKIINDYLKNFKGANNPDLTLDIGRCLYSEVNCIVLIQTIKYLKKIIQTNCVDYIEKSRDQSLCYFLTKALTEYVTLAKHYVHLLPITNECRKYIESHDIIKQLEKNKREQITSSANA
jgi:hypothetical protein